MSFVTSVVLVAAALGPAFLGAAPVVRHCSVRPFADGSRVEAAWKDADRMIRFTTVAKYDVAVDPSEVRALFDDSNVYLSATGWYDGKAMPPAEGRKAKNLFEFFVQADAANPRYVQVRVREDGTFDSYELAEGVRRKSEGETGIAAFASARPVETSGRHRGLCAWRANVTIPFAVLGAAAPTDDRAARIGVMRHNASLAGGRTEVSSLTPVIDNFTLPQYWQPVTFTRRAGAPRTVAGDVRDARVNYFANGEFDVPGRRWQAFPRGGQADRVETMAMSGEWIWRATGGTYRFLSGEPDSFEPETDYTLMVKARRFGDEGALRILTMKQLPDGRAAEGQYLGGVIELGADFHEYYFPFRTDADQPTAVNFYRMGKAAEDKGVEIAAVKLFRGKIGALELRPVSRIGMKRPVAGTALPMRPNPYGRRAEPLNALAFVRTMQDIREYQEMFAGLNVTLDVLRTTAVDQDIYETDSDLTSVRKRIEEGAYGLFLVGERAAERIGGEMAKTIEGAVRKGAGLVCCPNRRMLHFEKALADSGLKPLPDGHTLRRAFPYGLFRLEKRASSAPDAIRAGTLGKGRVVAYPCLRLRPRMEPRDYGTTDFPLSDYLDPWVARVLYWTAGFGDGPTTGRTVALGTAENLGKVITARLAVDEAGRTLDYEADVAEKAGPRVYVTPVDDSVKGDRPFAFEVSVTNAAGLAVRWRMEDFSGRVLETGTGAGRVEVPSRALYTNLGIFRAELTDGDRVVDAVRANAYARDRDIARTYDDFTASIWPMGDTIPPETIHAVDARLLDIGFRASLLPIGRTYANTLAGGLALGGGALGGGDVFCGHPHKDNVRTKGEVNTAKGRAVLAARARAEAESCRRYGVTQYMVCDEPNMSMRFSEMEPDEQPENIAEYRKRMERKYGTLAEYNRRHATAHATWDEVGPAHLRDARASGRYAEFAEWRAFNVDRWCEAIRLLAENGRDVDPDLKLSLYNSFGQTALSGNDYWKLLTRAGLGFSNEYTSMVYFGRNAIYNFDEFYRSFRPDMRVWGFTGYNLSQEQIAFMPWWFAAHRYGGFTWFAAWSWLWNILDIPTCALNGDAVALKRSLADSRLMEGLGKYTLVWDWAPRDVALYYSHESLVVATLLGTETKSFEIAEKGPLHEYMYSRQGLQYLVESLLYQHDFVASEQIVDKNSYKILFMPHILAMSDAEVGAVRRFAAQGGTVVADVLPGDYDELGVRRAENPFAAGEIRIWGRSFDDLDMAQHAEMLATLKAAGARPVMASDGIESLQGREAMRLTDGVGDLYMVLRMTARSSDAAEQTFAFPRAAPTWNVRTHEYLGVVDRVTTAVAPSSASVFAQLPFRPTALAASVPESAVRGEDAAFAFSMDVPESAAAARFVFNVKLTKPDGTSSFLFERNLDAPGGKAELRFRMAANDPAGTWTVTATEPLTGRRAVRTFALR